MKDKENQASLSLVSSNSKSSKANDRQLLKFVETARALGCDEGSTALDEAFDTIIVSLPVKDKEPTSKKD
jgi:hypothetical protein